METARDLNMETDEMQLVISALRGVGKRIVEVADTHKPLFAGEHFLTGRKCANGFISVPAPCRTTATGRLYPTRSLQARFSTRLRTWRRCYKRITRAVEQDKGNKRILLNGQRYSDRDVSTPSTVLFMSQYKNFRSSWVHFIIFIVSLSS